MARPIVGNYTEGKPCKKCGETLRYVKGHACVRCTRVRNTKKGDHAIAKITAKVRAAHARANIRSADDLRKALDLYASTNGAAERSKHLNQLARSRYATLLGETEAAAKPKQKTAGELHRAELPIGAFTVPAPYAEQDEQRREDHEAVFKAIIDLLPTLPDLATYSDIVERLPREITNTIAATRLENAVPRALARLGIGVREVQSKPDIGKRVYIVRDAGVFARMRQVDLARAYIAMVNDRKRLRQPAAVAQDSVKSEGRSETPGRREATQRPSLAV